MKKPAKKTKNPTRKRAGQNSGASHSIGELAKEFNISARTIRFYESKGLLAPERKGVQRSFRDGDRRRLVLILRTKNLGYSLEDIADHLSLYDSDPSQPAQTKLLLGRVDEAISDLKSMRVDLERAIADLKSIRTKCLGQLRKRGG